MLTAPADGQSLDTIIGELQSNYGVPAYPQEYRITIKVAEEKPAASGGGGGAGGGGRAQAPPADGAPRREKAPAAPRVAEDGPEGEAQADKPARKRRSRRRRGRGRSGPSGGQNPGSAGGESAPGPSAPPPPPPA